MERRYNVRIIDEPFTRSDGTVFEQTAIVRVLNESDRLGVENVKEVYRKIAKGEPINLSYCYLLDFSLEELRKIHGLESGEDIEMEEFNASHACFDGKTDLSYASFTGSASFFNAAFVGQDVSFQRAVFNDIDVDFGDSEFLSRHVSFQYAKFGKGKKSFEHARFDCDSLSFVNASFREGNVSFRGVLFRVPVVEFHFGHFGKGNIVFEKAHFYGNLDFRKVDMGPGKVDFRRSVFEGKTVSFDECTGDKSKLTFKRAHFRGTKVTFNNSILPKLEVVLDECEIERSNFSFLGIEMKEVSIQSSQVDGYMDFRVNRLESLNLANSVFRDVIDLKKGATPVDIEQIRLYGVRNLGMIIGSWEENNFEEAILSQEDTNNWLKAEQFRILKEGFSTSGQYDDEDKAYVQYKRHELKHNHAKRVAKGGITRIGAYPAKWFQQIVFDKMGLYATDPLRVLASIFVIYSLFSFAYLAMMKLGWGEVRPGADDPENMSDMAVAFYHSAITFFTVGYGDYSPWGGTRIIAMLEGFTGVFMMAYFTVAFVRKILR